MGSPMTLKYNERFSVHMLVFTCGYGLAYSILLCTMSGDVMLNVEYQVDDDSDATIPSGNVSLDFSSRSPGVEKPVLLTSPVSF